MVVEQGIDGSKTAPRSLAWLLRDDTALLVAVDNAVRAKPALKIGRQWGSDDAVELAFDVAPPKAGGAAGQPVILLLRGFASGEFQSSDESGAPAAVVRRAAEGVTYKARVVDAVRWTAEFRIPFAALGIDPAKQPRLPFNLSVRKTAENLWQMWAGTGGNTWFVDKAGFIELAP